MNTWYAIAPKSQDLETEISIFDEIGMFGVSAKQFISDLKNIPADHKIVLRIHSPGGEVFDGNAIFTALQRRGNVEVQIEGLAASMATVISLAGMPVKMAANGFYMIHNPWGVAMGDSDELRDQAQLLDKIRSNMVNAYAAKSGQAPEQIEEWMDAETWFTAAEAQAVGFVDEVTDSLALAASANRFSRLAKFRHAPAALLTPAAQQMENQDEIQEPVLEQPVDEAPAATVVSESAPEAPAPAQPAPSDEAPVPEEPAAPAAPVALAISSIDSLTQKYTDLLEERAAAIADRDAYRAKLESLSAEVETLRASLLADRESLARLERSLGLHAAEVVPVIQPHSDSASDPVAEYLAAVEAGDRKAASLLFEKHKAAIWQHRQKISKA